MSSKLRNDPLNKEWRNDVIFGILLFMTISVFLPRAYLSISILVFVVVSFLHKEFKQHIRRFFDTPLLWGMSLLFFIPLLSGTWSEQEQTWAEIMRIKLPLLVLPLAFASPFQLTKRQWEALAGVFILLITIGCLWSLFRYFANITVANEGYLRGKTFGTPMGNDHVRFSWLVAVATLLAAWFFTRYRSTNRSLGLLMASIIVLFVLYLHILAARTGLFSFYIIFGGFTLWVMFRKLKWQQGILLLLFFIITPLIAYKTLPSFQNRLKLMRYEYDFFKHADYRPGSNDGVRVISILGGLALMKKEPFTGVGFGDIQVETNKWYHENYPGMSPADKILPGSQVMIYAAGAGIFGLMIFFISMVIPFFTRTHHRLLWWLLNATVLFSLLIDIGLEVQHGVFVYSFIVLWWWKWGESEKNKVTTESQSVKSAGDTM